MMLLRCYAISPAIIFATLTPLILLLIRHIMPLPPLRHAAITLLPCSCLLFFAMPLLMSPLMLPMLIREGSLCRTRYATATRRRHVAADIADYAILPFSDSRLR